MSQEPSCQASADALSAKWALMVTCGSLGGSCGRLFQIVWSRRFEEVRSNKDIDNTEQLIQAYNKTTDELELDALKDWIDEYISWFVNQGIELLKEEDIWEYLLLGQLTVRSGMDKELLLAYFASWCNKIQRAQFGIYKIVPALEIVLTRIDKSIFEDRSGMLIELAQVLLSLLKGTEFTKSTFGTHGATLFALHRTFVVMHAVLPQLLDPSAKRGDYQLFKTRLEEIENQSGRYYPFVYLISLIKQSLQRLEEGKNNPTLAGTCKRLFHGVVGALNIFSGFLGFVSVDFRHDAFQAGWRNLKDAFKSHRIPKKEWYDGILNLMESGFKASEDPKKYSDFETCCKELLQKQISRKKEDRKVVHFAIMNQLQYLVLHTSDEDVRSKGMTELMRLREQTRGGNVRYFLRMGIR